MLLLYENYILPFPKNIIPVSVDIKQYHNRIEQLWKETKLTTLTRTYITAQFQCSGQAL
jgi:hypothetical protein